MDCADSPATQLVQPPAVGAEYWPSRQPRHVAARSRLYLRLNQQLEAIRAVVLDGSPCVLHGL